MNSSMAASFIASLPKILAMMHSISPRKPWSINHEPHATSASEPAINAAARDARAVLLANHGPVVSGKTLSDAVYAAEELEEAAKLFLMLRGRSPRLLTASQVDDLLSTFG